MWQETLYEVFQAIVILPLTAGNVHKRGGLSRRHDGRISSIVLGISLLAFLFVVVIVRSTEEGSKYLSLDVIKGIIIVINLLAILSILLLFRIGFKHSTDLTLVNKDGAARLKVVFIWLFGLSVIVNYLIFIGISLSCTGQFDRTGIVQNVLMIIFVLTQQIFISCFFRYHFPYTIEVHYYMLIVCVFNLSVWFYHVIFKDPDDFDKYSNFTEQYPNVSGNCAFKMATMSVRHTLYPAVIEHCLLAVNFIVLMWDPNREQALRASIRSLLGTRSQINGDDATSSDERNITSSERFRVTYRFSITFNLSVLFGIIINAFLIIGFFIYIDNDEPLEDYHYLLLFKIVYKIFWTALLYVAFYKIYRECHPKWDSQSLNVGDFILIAGAFGLTIYHALALLAGLYTDQKYYRSGHCVIVENVFNIFVAYLQTVFILQLERYEKNFQRQPGAFPISTICILLFLFNSGFWIVDTFFERPYPGLSKIENIFYKEKWSMISNSIFSLAIFYRFQSATKCFALYTQFRE